MRACGSGLLTRSLPLSPFGTVARSYTDLSSRLPSTATSLFGNNVAKFVLSVGPQTGGAKGEWSVDYEDDAVRGKAPDPHLPSHRTRETAFSRGALCSQRNGSSHRSLNENVPVPVRLPTG